MMRFESRAPCVALIGLAGLFVWPTAAIAEPPPCYADAPVVLAAPMEYGRAYRVRDTSVAYVDDTAAVRYQRAYAEPYTETTRVITTTTPTVVYDEPMVYARTYSGYGPVGYVGLSFGSNPYVSFGYGAAYGYYGSSGYYDYPRRYTRYRHSPSRRYYGYGHRGSSYRNRAYGPSRHYSRGHQGHGRSRGQSFSRGSRSGRSHARSGGRSGARSGRGIRAGSRGRSSFGRRGGSSFGRRR